MGIICLMICVTDWEPHPHDLRGAQVGHQLTEFKTTESEVLKGITKVRWSAYDADHSLPNTPENTS